MTRGLQLAAQAGALALALAGHAHAAVVSAMPDQPLTTTPFDVSLGGATFSFTAADTGYGPGAAVATGGNGLVTSFFGSVTDFEAGASIDQVPGELYGFSAFAAPGIIPFSAADDFIGLAFADAAGQHFGYAEVAGSELVSYGYESAPDTTILTGAVAPIPEPASLALLLVGTIALAATTLRRRSSSPSLRGGGG